jgi:hypothetical protein
MNNIPKELNWVEKRAACNVGKIFDELCEGIASDVAAINVAKNLHQDFYFVLNSVSIGNAVIVGQLGVNPWPKRVIVRIGIVENEIEVQDGAKNASWRVGIALNNEGRCILRSGDEELEQWQFRKRALESLFFEEKSV